MMDVRILFLALVKIFLPHFLIDNEYLILKNGLIIISE